jgi:hypothetical protein
LDSYILSKKISDAEWESIVLQILFTLITYQKVFHFTHNDLHTNNIVYVFTEKKYLYYKYNNIHYKVPTFGKIYKIIDFGRAIYKFKNKFICSDSYSEDGDASTQYNCEPYFNENKPRIDPNYSFDLCRLGCSLFDYFIEDLETEYRQAVAFHAKHTNTFYEPYVETIVDDDITDDRNYFFLDKDNDLYIYVNIGNFPQDITVNNTLYPVGTAVFQTGDIKFRKAGMPCQFISASGDTLCYIGKIEIDVTSAPYPQRQLTFYSIKVSFIPGQQNKEGRVGEITGFQGFGGRRDISTKLPRA